MVDTFFLNYSWQSSSCGLFSRGELWALQNSISIWIQYQKIELCLHMLIVDVEGILLDLTPVPSCVFISKKLNIRRELQPLQNSVSHLKAAARDGASAPYANCRRWRHSFWSNPSLKSLKIIMKCCHVNSIFFSLKIYSTTVKLQLLP